MIEGLPSFLCWVDDIEIYGENQRLSPGRGRIVLNDGYRMFKEELVIHFKAHKQRETINGSFKAWVGFWTRKDIQNCQKAILDALEISGVVSNDRNCVSLKLDLMGRPRKKGQEKFVVMVESLE